MDNELNIHPGETFAEVMENRNINVEQLIEMTNYNFDVKYINDVLNGYAAITPDFANALAYALNVPASFWINLQRLYDKRCEKAR